MLHLQSLTVLSASSHNFNNMETFLKKKSATKDFERCHRRTVISSPCLKEMCECEEPFKGLKNLHICSVPIKFACWNLYNMWRFLIL